MPAPSLLDQLQKKFGDRITGSNVTAIDPWIEVAPEAIVDVCRYLRDDPNTRMDLLNCVSVVDYGHPDPKVLSKAGFEEHLEVVYHLSSTVKKHTLVLKVILPRWEGGEPGRLPEVPSVAEVWRTADWHERECFDLGGVFFSGHPDLRRILCPEDWVGYPLRKDYEMPLEYHGIRGR